MSLLPILFKPFSGGLATIGALFMSVRIGSLIGGSFCPRFLVSKFAGYKICAAAELINSAGAFALYYCAIKHLPIHAACVLLFKTAATGLIASVRFAWLRSTSDVTRSGRAVTTINIISQSVYGLSGLALILGAGYELSKAMVIIDGLTSILGAIIFIRLRDVSAAIGDVSCVRIHGIFRFLRSMTGTQWWVLLADLLLASAFGGTNILLVQAGDGFLRSHGGYPGAMIFYSACFVLGGVLFHTGMAPLSQQRLLNWSPILMPLGFALTLAPESSFGLAHVIGFIAVFFAYPILFLELQRLWFTLSDTQTAVVAISIRTLLYGVIMAGMELGFANFGSASLMRGALSALAIGAFFAARRK
jgi:hypothetical protein